MALLRRLRRVCMAEQPEVTSPCRACSRRQADPEESPASEGDDVSWARTLVRAASPATRARRLFQASTARFESGFALDSTAGDASASSTELDDEFPVGRADSMASSASIDSVGFKFRRVNSNASASTTDSVGSKFRRVNSNASASTTDESDSESAEESTLRIQVRIHGFWRAVAPCQARKIEEHLANGELQFFMTAKGRTYNVDFSRAGDATQTDVDTKRVRRLRLLSSTGRRESASAPASDELAAAEQRMLGPQCMRGEAPQTAMRHLVGNLHLQCCFCDFAQRERQHCDEYAVFYHSYSRAALIYEVQAAIANVLFGYASRDAPLPRLLMSDFYETPDAASVLRRFNAEFASGMRDHDPAYRKVALSTMCSPYSQGPELCLAKSFARGYSCKDLDFQCILANLLQTIGYDEGAAIPIVSSIIKLAESFGLDAANFGGREGSDRRTGHILQIFIRRSLVDKLAYAAAPYGFVDEQRMPLSEWVGGDNNFAYGQARVVAHPELFMQPGHVKMYVASADPCFHSRRGAFQRKLGKLFAALRERKNWERAMCGIYGGVLPEWVAQRAQR